MTDRIQDPDDELAADPEDVSDETIGEDPELAEHDSILEGAPTP